MDASSAKPLGLAMFEFLMSYGLLAQAERDNRRITRERKREVKHAAYHANGLNGPRAMARRARQSAFGGDQSGGFVPLRSKANSGTNLGKAARW